MAISIITLSIRTFSIIYPTVRKRVGKGFHRPLSFDATSSIRQPILRSGLATDRPGSSCILLPVAEANDGRRIADTSNGKKGNNNGNSHPRAGDEPLGSPGRSIRLRSKETQ